MPLKLKIVDAHGIIFEGDVDFCEVPSTGGIEGILPSHINFISGFAGGEIRYFINGKAAAISLPKGGFIEASEGRVNILAEA